MNDELVLVTGGTGFIAQHCMLALLRGGYRIRATVRSRSREREVRAHLAAGGVDAGNRLSFVVADLGADEGWADAVSGCTYVMHGASPTPSGQYASEADWVRPAVDGNLRVLRAARDAGVRRVVLTSAFGAIGVGHKASHRRPFDETDWSDLSGDVAPYQKSKTLSERAAWDFIAREGKGLELAAVNPVAVLGPVLGPDYSHSIKIVENLLGNWKGCPKIYSCFVDARDVADLHLRAMTHPAANGERFLAVSGEGLWLADVARILRRRMGAVGRNAATRTLPNWFVRLASLRNPRLKGLVPMLGVDMSATGGKAMRLLDWKPRSPEEAIVATAESLVRLGVLKG